MFNLSIFRQSPVNYKTTQGLSQRSVDSYKRILDQWAEHAGNNKIAQINDSEINKYLVYMRTEYVPRRFNGNTRAFSKITA